MSEQQAFTIPEGMTVTWEKPIRFRFSRSPLADRSLTRVVDGVMVAIAQPSGLHQLIAIGASR